VPLKSGVKRFCNQRQAPQSDPWITDLTASRKAAGQIKKEKGFCCAKGSKFKPTSGKSLLF
jgi:hypothetical protein